MSSRPFVHLHCHSHYSLLDGASKIPDLVQRVKALGMPALALTDHGNLYGAVEFLREAKAAGIMPIVGLEAYVAPGKRTDRTTSAGGNGDERYAFHLTLLARNGEGFRNLLRLSSRSFLEGFYYKPRIDKEILERHSEGLICLSGCASAEFSDHILHGKTAEAEKLCAWYQKVFGEENFFVEIQNNGVADPARLHGSAALDVARRMGLPLVATSDAHYLTAGRRQAHDVLLCINTGKTVDDPNRMRFETDEFHVRSPEEMYAAMPGPRGGPGARRRGSPSWSRTNYESLEPGQAAVPLVPAPRRARRPRTTSASSASRACASGTATNPPPDGRRAARARAGHHQPDGVRLVLPDRLGLRPLRPRERASPARRSGSACGALVSYLLYLSHVCPLKYDLLFERFLDPNRSEAPDIDIDLCQERRYEVIEYVRKKYGEANVAQIGTFGTMAAKAAIKDVGRALNIPLARVEQVTKLIPTRLNITLEEALKEEPALQRLVDEDPEIERADRLRPAARRARRGTSARTPRAS